MPAGGAEYPASDPTLIIVPDGLVAEERGGYALHPALQFMCPRLRRSAKLWAEAHAMTPIECYGAVIAADRRASGLLATAMGDAIPADARQGWLFSPFAGRLGRDSVHIMPEEMFAWDKADSEWLLGLLQPLLAGDGFRLLSRDGCMLAVTASPWDAKPHGFAQVAGRVLPNRHPAGADGGRLMRLCAEIQMLLATQPSQRRQEAGLPNVMGVWLWAPSVLPATPTVRPRVISDDALVRTCTADATEALPVAIMRATQVEAQPEHHRIPRHWLLGGDGHAVLLDTRALPRFGRKLWQPKSAIPFVELRQRLRRIAGLQGHAA